MGCGENEREKRMKRVMAWKFLGQGSDRSDSPSVYDPNMCAAYAERPMSDGRFSQPGEWGWIMIPQSCKEGGDRDGLNFGLEGLC